MPSLIPTSFTRYQFTDNEMSIAAVFTDMQLAYLMTERAVAAEEKLRISFDFEQPDRFRLEHEYLRGKIEMLDYILSVHDTYKEAQRELMKRQAEMQKI